MSVVIQPEHSPIGASSYYRWKACPGSVRLSRGAENQESEYARIGTLAHEMAAGVLESIYFDSFKPATPLDLNAEDMDAVRTYTDFIKALVKETGCDHTKGELLIEHKFDLSSVHKGLYGTADAVIYDRQNKILHVCDYKHGAGIPVEVENNLQLMYYGLGALLSTGFPCDKIRLGVIQPRCDHPKGVIRQWEFSSLDLLDFAADLAEDAKATEQENAPVVPGSHCRFCPAAAAHCPTLHQKAITTAKMQFKKEINYIPEDLSKALKALPAIEAWVKNVREFAYQESMRGRVPPGYKLVAKRVSRKWKLSEEDMVKEFDRRIGVQDIYVKKLVTPYQLEQRINKKTKDAIKDLIVSESGGFKVVKESEKGAPVQVGPVTEFEVINGK